MYLTFRESLGKHESTFCSPNWFVCRNMFPLSEAEQISKFIKLYLTAVKLTWAEIHRKEPRRDHFSTKRIPFLISFCIVGSWDVDAEACSIFVGASRIISSSFVSVGSISEFASLVECCISSESWQAFSVELGTDGFSMFVESRFMCCGIWLIVVGEIVIGVVCILILCFSLVVLNSLHCV